MKNLHTSFAGTISLMLLLGCSKHGYEDRYGPFYIQDSTTIFMDGDMGSRVDKIFEHLIEDYPAIKLVIFGECPGSRDDEAMIRAATLLRNRGINTHLLSTSIIESGAVDFYLAGTTRTRESGSLIGVHAWSDGHKSATDYPIDATEHQLYIEYYIFCGFTAEKAEALYFYFIQAAAPDDIHFMTDDEIIAYQITTN